MVMGYAALAQESPGSIGRSYFRHWPLPRVEAGRGRVRRRCKRQSWDTQCMRCRLDGNDQQGLCSLEPGTAPADQSPPPPVTADSGRSKPRSAKSFPATEEAARMTMRRRPPRRERSHRQPDTCNYPSIPYVRDLESGARMVLGPLAGCRLRRGSSLSSTSSCPAGSRSPQSPVVRFASFDQAIEQRQLCSVSLGKRRTASRKAESAGDGGHTAWELVACRTRDSGTRK